VEAILCGIIGGLVGSSLFLIILSRFRPKLAISKVMSVAEYEGKKVYSFKVLNIGSRRAISIRAELYIIGYRAVKGASGRGKKYYQIPLLKEHFIRLEPLGEKSGEFSSFEFSTDIDLEAEWKSKKESYMLCFVTAQDDLTSFNKTFEVSYDSLNESLKKGRFGYGKDMTVHS